MEFALLASQRGHDVTLYEKTDRLGGLINTTRGVDIKWTLVKYADYMAKQVEKSKVEVKLNTAATPELLKRENYDEVIVAIGAEPAYPPIPGVKGKNVIPAVELVGQEDALSHDIVVVGGGEIGVEMGIHMARKGHNVTLLEMGDILSPESVPVHFRSIFEKTWEEQEGFSYQLNARVTQIAEDGVTYVDKDGAEHKISAGNVILAAGMKAKHEEAKTFFDGNVRVHMIGDCNKVGCVQTGVRAAYALAKNI
jgi:NADPH-dependent 2,4-dienoyl-CoA reductase/sulfur reductase-like enzyme